MLNIPYEGFLSQNVIFRELLLVNFLECLWVCIQSPQQYMLSVHKVLASRDRLKFSKQLKIWWLRKVIKLMMLFLILKCSMIQSMAFLLGRTLTLWRPLPWRNNGSLLCPLMGTTVEEVQVIRLPRNQCRKWTEPPCAKLSPRGRTVLKPGSFHHCGRLR